MAEDFVLQYTKIVLQRGRPGKIVSQYTRVCCD